MAEKFSIYAGPPLEVALAGYESARSARINLIADEYWRLVALLSPTLTQPQWLALIDALMSTWIDDGPTLRHIWADVQETDGLGEKWRIDQAALVERIRTLSEPELIALREVIRRYRLIGGTDPVLALMQAGARIGGPT